MKIEEIRLRGALLIEPRVYSDSRGSFYESYQEQRFQNAGITTRFVQDNHSRSLKGVLRGLHFQCRKSQAQLVFVSHGAIFDVIVDLRENSPTFGCWSSITLSDDHPRQLFMPPGFAHGFYTLTDVADVHYKVSEYYNPDDEGGILWNDPNLAIGWPVSKPIVGERDAKWPQIKTLARESLPQVRLS